MAKIEKISAREILDSRGNPTVEATVILSDGAVGVSSVPSGAGRGTYEAHELRDGDATRFKGLGVIKAIESINSVIAPGIIGIEATHQQEVDKKMIEMDGTQNKGRLGGNSILSVSQAVAKAAAKSSLLPLSVYLRQFLSFHSEGHKIPTPIFNMIEGGKHADSGVDFQEFLVIPASSFDYSTSLQIGITIYNALKEYLKNSNFTTGVADESGFAPDFATNLDAIKALRSAIETTAHPFSKDVFLGLDAAASAFVNNRKYSIKDKSGQVDASELQAFYKSIINEYSIIYLEDPFAEDDWEAWRDLYSEIGSNSLIVGDDLTSTNPYRLQMAINNTVVNGISIKPNQIGTITEALAVVEIAKYKNLKIVVASRSGETNDDFIADFSVAVGAEYVKFGAPAHERVIKYNRLLEIEQELKKLNSV